MTIGSHLPRMFPAALRNFSSTRVFPPSLKITDIPTAGFKRVVSVDDTSGSGLRAIVAIYSTKLGPALGGLRILPYSTFDDALTDVKRLAIGMGHKSALAGIGLDGGKAVMLSDPKKVTKEMLNTFSVVLNYLGGDYVTAEDVGSNVEMIDEIAKGSPYATGLSSENSSGDPSPYTAWGGYRGIQATCQVLDGKDSVTGKTVAIQGVGNVGEKIAKWLYWHGAKLIVADKDNEKLKTFVKEYKAIPCSPEEIHKQPCDIFAPCALGGTINSQTIPELRCRAIAGCANNQLLESSDAEKLQKRGILYAPDFVINAGGIINISFELDEAGYNPRAARDAVDKIYFTVKNIFDVATHNGMTTQRAAVEIAENRIKNGIGKRTTPPKFHHWKA